MVPYLYLQDDIEPRKYVLGNMFFTVFLNVTSLPLYLFLALNFVKFTQTCPCSQSMVSACKND